MKKAISVLLAALMVLTLAAQPVEEKAGEEKTLTLYAYDTFCGDWGSAATLIPAFEEKTGIKVNVVASGNAVEVINKVLLEGDNTECDVIFGVTDDLTTKIIDRLEPYATPYLSSIYPSIIFDDTNRLIPFDWGVFAFVWDSESSIEPPKSLWDLTKPEYKDKVILIDPRTSSVGTGLMMWTYNAHGDRWLEWWKAMEENALTIASGWSSAYGLFTEGEAPIVLSYTTSPVYHVMNEDTTRYQTLIFQEGHEATIEGVGIIKGTKHREEAEAFIDFMLSEGQVNLAVTNSMYPAVMDAQLPEAYSYAPIPDTLYTGSADTASNLLVDWTENIAK